MCENCGEELVPLALLSDGKIVAACASCSRIKVLEENDER